MVEKDVTQGIPLGITFKSQGRTLGEGDFSLLTNLTWTTGPIHSDKEHMAKTAFGERVLAGGITLALMGGLAGTSDLNRVLGEHGVHITALLSYEDVAFKSPVLPGDTLSVTSEIASATATEKPGRGVIKYREVCTNQRDQVVVQATRVYLFERRE